MVRGSYPFLAPCLPNSQPLCVKSANNRLYAQVVRLDSLEQSCAFLPSPPLCACLKYLYMITIVPCLSQKVIAPSGAELFS